MRQEYDVNLELTVITTGTVKVLAHNKNDAKHIAEISPEVDDFVCIYRNTKVNYADLVHYD